MDRIDGDGAVSAGKPGGGADWRDGFSLASDQWQGAWVVVDDGDCQGRTYRLGQRVATIGRQHGNQIQLVDSGVSRRHCQIRPGQDCYEILDMSSKSGTWVNGNRAEAAVKLLDGMEITVGTVRLRFEAQASHPVDFGLARKAVDKGTQKTTTYVDGGAVASGGEADMAASIMALGEVTKAVSGNLSRGDKLAAVAAIALDQLAADRVLFLAGSDKGWGLESHFSSSGLDPQQKGRQPHRKLMSETVSSGNTTLAVNRAGDPKLPITALCAPIFRKEVIVGLLYIDRVRQGAADFGEGHGAFGMQVGRVLGGL